MQDNHGTSCPDLTKEKLHGLCEIVVILAKSPQKGILATTNVFDWYMNKISNFWKVLKSYFLISTNEYQKCLLTFFDLDH